MGGKIPALCLNRLHKKNKIKCKKQNAVYEKKMDNNWAPRKKLGVKKIKTCLLGI